MSAGVSRALDRLRFGPRRTLNVREGGLTGVDAARRVDGWLRGKQVELTGDVLIITGRGAGSRDGVPVVRQATHRTLNALKRQGVVAAIREDTPGSFVVTLAPLRALLEAPARRKQAAVLEQREREPIPGIDPETGQKLRALALRALDSLGIPAPSETMITAEMERQFSLLVRGAPSGPGVEVWLADAISRGLREYEES